MSVLTLGFTACPGFSQEPEKHPKAPQILTTDLKRRQTSEFEKLPVSFVVYDDDQVVKVLINSAPQPFEPAATVVINREFTLKPGKNLITVTAIDEQNHRRTRRYLVIYGEELGDLPPEKAEPEDTKQPRFNWQVNVGLSYESDSNPSNDIGIPVKVGDIEIKGVIDDSAQADVRTSMNALALFSYGKLNSFVGASSAGYGKSMYEKLQSKVVFGEVGWRPRFTESDLLAAWRFLDISTGGTRYSQQHLIGLGYQFGTEDKQEGNRRHIFRWGYTRKDFADASAKDGGQHSVKWEYQNMDPEQQDRFRSLIALGNTNEGYRETEQNFVRFDFDWKNQWHSGVLFDIGFGFGFRRYPNQAPLTSETALGETRTDLPLRFSTALGWNFLQGWSAGYHYRYTFKLSNKAPSTRSLQGLQVQGTF